MNNTQIARMFADIAALLQLNGESVFKIRAYERAAETIGNLSFQLTDVAADAEKLRAIPGFGEAITSKVQEIAATGSLSYYDRLKAEFPVGVLDLMKVPGIGPKTALKATQELGIKNLSELEMALESGTFAKLPRIGEKSAANILRHLKHRMSQGDRVPLGEAMPEAARVMTALQAACPGVRNLGFAGSLRRGCETVGDIDLLCTADDPAAVIAAFVSLPFVKDVMESEDTKGSIVIDGALQVDLRVTADDAFGGLLLYFTGSQQHGMRLRERAQQMGLSLNEYGLTDAATGRMETFATEEAVYRRLGLPFIPPEMREDSGELEAASQNLLSHPVEMEDIRGDLHSHTDWTDGKAPLAEMVASAKSRGWQYLAVTDHSQSQTVASGLNAELLREHTRAVRGLDAKSPGIRLLAGTEMDILPDGSLDYPDDALMDLDVVLGSIHSAMDQSRDTMTARIIKAMHSPHVDIVAHLTTRLMKRRAPVDLDFDAICRVAVETGTLLEVNASAERLDLKDAHVRRAVELGVAFAISTDSHRATDFLDMRYGVQIARRGWCERWRVVNTLPFEELRAFLSSPKSERYSLLARITGAPRA
ncbi:MAG: DNA polymerase/3'-5' exonuclease PolX [Dehalococcoidia bacterium]|nr:DNA polymerase/3'-5' exonuclease PolX [Dehalococcoidia bacterium]